MTRHEETIIFVFLLFRRNLNEHFLKILANKIKLETKQVKSYLINWYIEIIKI